MAQTNVDILLRVRDEASAKLKGLANSMGGVIGSIQSLAGAFGVAGAVGAGLATAAAGATALAKHYGEVAEKIGSVSAATGVSATNIQVFRKALELAGGSADEADTVIKRLNLSLAAHDPLLQRIGVKGGDTWTAMMKLADAFSRTEAGSTKQAAAFKLLGKSADTAIGVLSQGSKAMDDFGTRMQGMGVIMSDATVKRFQTFDSQIDELQLSLEAFKLVIAQSVLPMLIAFLNVVEQFRIRLAILPATIDLLGHSLQYLATFTDPVTALLGGGERTSLKNAMADDALRLAAAAVKASKELEELKAAMEALRTVRVPGFGDGNAGPFVLGRTVGMGMADSEAKLRPGPAPGKYAIGPLLDEAKTKVISFSELLEKMAGNTVRALETIGGSVYNGIVNVFTNLTNKAQTFGSAMKGIWDSMVLGIEQAIGRLVASYAIKEFLQILGWALSAITGNPFFAAAGQAAGTAVGPVTGTSMEGVSMVSPGGGSGPAPTFGMSPAGGGGNTYVIQTISSKDVLQSLISPMGAMRSANSRLIEVAAAS